MMFEKLERTSLIVYLYYHRDWKKLLPYGDVTYHSRKLRYVQLYLESSKLEETLSRLNKEPFVKEVSPSFLKDLGDRFQGVLQEERPPILEK